MAVALSMWLVQFFSYRLLSELHKQHQDKLEDITQRFDSIKLTLSVSASLSLITGWNLGAQWLSGRVLDLRPKGCGLEPQRRHCVVVLEQDTFILA